MQVVWDKREEALSRAITGKDRELAAALATEPESMSTLSANNHDALKRQFLPSDASARSSRIAIIRQAVNGARITLDEITESINGAIA